MLQLYINGQLADIKDESIISVTQTYESVNNPTLYYSSFSKTIKLPITANNNAIFSNFNRLDSIVTNLSIDPAKKMPFILTSNREPVMEGYLHLDNANTIWNDECFEVTLYSSIGLVFNTIKLLTFNKNAEGVDPEYIIDSPLSDDLKINRNLVKQSFEQQNHLLDSDNILDWIGFIPTYQGKYSDFSSDKEQLLPSGRTDDMTRERDEHYMREFRSYYQQPFIWVDKLWKVVKDKVEQITDYTMNLDGSWFTSINPYYSQLIYTCPSLFTSDDNYKSINEMYERELNKWTYYKPSKTPTLNTHKLIHLNSLNSNTNTGIYDPVTGVFNPNADAGGTVFKGELRLTLSAPPPSSNTEISFYGKIRDDNPFYVRIKAVNADTGEDILGAKKTFLLYSDDTDAGAWTYDEGIDVGIAALGNADVFVGVTNRPKLYSTGYHTFNDAYFWEADLDFSINVTENVPYKIYAEIWNANNDDPFETCGSSLFGHNPTWDWLWSDFFVTSGNADKGFSMYFDTVVLSCETQENLRSNSDVTMYRIFPKDTTLFDVILNYSKMFGLMWYVDEDEKTITVMSRNRFFADSVISDWSDKVDRSKEFKFSPLNFDKRYVTFNFDSGACGRLEKYESMYQYTYGSKKLDTGYEFNSEENKLYDKLVPSVISQKRQYSKMMNTQYPDSPNFMGYSYMVYPNEHFVDNDKEGSTAGMSGAFYFRNGTFLPDSQVSNQYYDGTYVFVVTDDTEHQIQTQEYCWNSTGDNAVLCRKFPDVSTISNMSLSKRWSVHFESPKEYFFVTPDGDTEYIYKNFWENYINERYCTQNKKLTAYIYISPEEYKHIDFTEFVKIDNILYHIDKIYDYNFNSFEPVKMDLVQVWDLSAYTAGQYQFPYLYTIPETVTVTTTDQTVDVYSSSAWDIVASSVPDWITCSQDGNGDLTIRANSATDVYRTGYVTLMLGVYNPMLVMRNYATYQFKVLQYPANPYRLNVDRNTLVFNGSGGSETVIVDCHNVTNNAISVTDNRNWISAAITEYTQDTATRRDCLHLVVTASRNLSTRPRNGSVTLSISAGGNTYTQTVNIGQQGGNTHTRDHNEVVITEDPDFEVYDTNDTRVTTTLVSGNEYHFSDLFPEEIDVNTLSITNGTIDITGKSGRQTVTFTPQLTNGATEGGGMITALTMNGNIVSYNYNVSDSLPAPTARKVRVSAGQGGLFKIEAQGTSMRPQTTNYYEDRFVDGTVLNISAVPEDGYTFSEWADSVGNIYSTPDIVVTVDSSLVDADGYIVIKVGFKESQEIVTLTVNAGDSNCYLTIGNDSTHYSQIVKTVTVGTTIPNIRARGSAAPVRTFSQWSDGSTTNPRDFTLYRDTTVTAVWTGGVNLVNITLDGGGLTGANDSVSLYLDGSLLLKCGLGEVNTARVSEATYRLELVCDINDNQSVFDFFDIGGTQYAQNPYTNASWNLNNDVTIKLQTSPVVMRNIRFDTRGLVGANDNAVLSLDGNTVATGRYGQIQYISVPQGTYSLEIQCNIVDAGSSFDHFTINGTDYSTNPYTNGSWVLNSNSTISVNVNSVPMHTITMDGRGLLGHNDTIELSLDGVVVASATYGQTSTVSVQEGEYSLALRCNVIDAGSQFDYFTINGTDYYTNPYTDANWQLDSNKTVFAKESALHNVNISAGSNGSVSVNGVIGNYSQSVPSGTTLTLQATANAGYQFNGWSDGNSDNPRSITVTSDTTLTAAFVVIPFENIYFFVEDVSGNNNTLSIQKSSASAPTIEVFKSSDQTNWTSMGSTSTTPITATIPANSKLYLKAITEKWGSYNTITASGNYNVGGNIMSLLYGDNFQNQTTFQEFSSRNFYALFDSSTTLISAGNLVLPATTLTISCYDSMFYGCSSLTTAPATLPATSMKEKCYYEMFKGCTSLINTQSVLPATILDRECYYGMFHNCTALTTAPEILGTSFTSSGAFDSCQNMFYNCTSLVNPPSILPATTLATSCYEQMFYNCTSLTTAPELPATTLANDCYLSMFWGCTALTTAPELPATTLIRNCYYNMFRNCTSLTTAPELKASTLATYCYSSMFEGCINLKKVLVYADDISANACLYRWLYNVNASGDFYNLGSATYPSGDPSGIPTGWTEHHSL